MDDDEGEHHVFDSSSTARKHHGSQDLKRHFDGDNNICDGIHRNYSRRLKESRINGEEDADEIFSLFHDKVENLAKCKTSTENGICPIEPFNLTSEREDGMGYFDGDTFVFRQRKNKEVEDAWLDQLQDHGSSTLNQYKFPNVRDFTRQENEENNREMKFGSKNEQSSSLTLEQIHHEIANLLATGSETVIKALHRYGSIMKREKKEVGMASCESASYKAFNRLTELSNVCMLKFQILNVYERNRHYFQSFLETKSKKSQHTNCDESSDKDLKEIVEGKSCQNGNIEWEYRGTEDNVIHGPFSSKKMLDWIELGYFVGDMVVDVRLVLKKSGMKAVEPLKKEISVESLLEDLEESENSDSQVNKWLRSDEVDFSNYL